MEIPDCIRIFLSIIGAGPRHLALDETTQIAYVLNELKKSVNVLQIGIDGEIVASMVEVDYDSDDIDTGVIFFHLVNH